MIRFTLFRSVLCWLLMPAFSALSAQQATLHGKIVDATNGEALIGATVLIEGTTLGAMADLDGNYSLKLAAGTYTVKCRYVSYQDQTITQLKLNAGEVKQLDFTLKSTENALGEIVIEAEQVRNTDASLIALQRKSIAIQDGISTQQISRSGASNAAESMRQMTGANVQDGKYLVMRGLGDRYSITQLNGLPMASPDPYRNSSSLDLIPSSFIDNIVTLKSFTPDMPGNFTGGNVDISTKALPETFTLNFSTLVGYNSLASLKSNFLSSAGDASETFGFPGGTRALPEMYLNDDFRNAMTPGRYIEARNPSKPDQIRADFQQSARGLSSNFMPEATRAPLDSRYEFSMGGKFRFLGMDWGALGGLRFAQSYQQYTNGIINTWVNNVQPVLFGYQQLSDHKSVANPQSGGFAALTAKLNAHHQINFTGIYSNDAEIMGRQQQGSFVGQVSNSDAVFHTNSIQFTQRELRSGQLSGRHVFTGLKNAELNWTAAANRSIQDEPDLKYFAYTTVTDYFDREDENGNIFQEYTTEYYLNNAEYARPFHYFRYLQDDQLQGRIDLKIPLSGDKDNHIKFGAYYSQLNRSFKEYRFELADNAIPAELRFTQYLNERPGDFNGLFSAANIGIIDTVYNAAGEVTKYQHGYYYVNQSIEKNFYLGNQAVAAAYAMGVWELGARLKAVGGLRLEKTLIEVESQDTSQINVGGNLVEASGRIDLTDYLPSLNFIYKLNDRSNLRLGATQTVARPNLREIAPFVQFDNKNGFFSLGNPSLKRTLIQNADVRYEFFPKPGELIAFSLYGKFFTDPIVQAFNNTTIPELVFINVPRAEVYGAEFEFRKNLESLSSVLKHFQVATNLSYIYSRVDMPDNELKTSQDFDSTFTQQKRPFVGQSPYIINLILSYVQPDLGTEAAVSFNVSGNKLYQIALVATPDIYEQAIPLLNLKVQQRFLKRFNASFNVQNILGSKLLRYQDFKGQRYTSESYALGTLYRLGISYTFKQ
ncbi:MAG: TonB-dependent receptor domain-containing protein [Bacteroidia bacterium]